MAMLSLLKDKVGEVRFREEADYHLADRRKAFGRSIGKVRWPGRYLRFARVDPHQQTAGPRRDRFEVALTVGNRGPCPHSMTRSFAEAAHTAFARS